MTRTPFLWCISPGYPHIQRFFFFFWLVVDGRKYLPNTYMLGNLSFFTWVVFYLRFTVSVMRLILLPFGLGNLHTKRWCFNLSRVTQHVDKWASIWIQAVLTPECFITFYHYCIKPVYSVGRYLGSSFSCFFSF